MLLILLIVWIIGTVLIVKAGHAFWPRDEVEEQPSARKVAKTVQKAQKNKPPANPRLSDPMWLAAARELDELFPDVPITPEPEVEHASPNIPAVHRKMMTMTDRERHAFLASLCERSPDGIIVLDDPEVHYQRIESATEPKILSALRDGWPSHPEVARVIRIEEGSRRPRTRNTGPL